MGKPTLDGPHRLMTTTLNPQESRNTLRAAAASFTVFASYYLVRPIRDEIGAEHRELLAVWWTWVAIVALCITPLYSLLVSRVNKAKIPSRVYMAASAVLLAFAFAFQILGEGSRLLSGCFYVLLSLFPLFVVSVLWSSLTALFSSAASKRQFGRIFAAGTTGGLLASGLVTLTAGGFFSFRISPSGFLLLATALLLSAAWILRPSKNLQSRATALQQGTAREVAATELATSADPNRDQALSRGSAQAGHWSTGLKHLLRSPYLRGMALNLLLFTVGSGFLYFMQSDLLNSVYEDRGDRRAVLGSMDTAVQALTLLTQFFGTAGVIRKWGMAAVLSIVPILSLAGFITLSIQPLFLVFAAFYILRRASNYALAKPAREILYTVVTPEERYLTKPILDVGVYRFGDLLTAWMYEGLQALTSFGVAGMALFAAPFCLAWIPIARFLGRSQEQADAKK